MSKSKLPSVSPESRSLSSIAVTATLTSLLAFYRTECVFINAEYERALLHRQYVKRSFYEGQLILCKSVIQDLVNIINNL